MEPFYEIRHCQEPGIILVRSSQCRHFLFWIQAVTRLWFLVSSEMIAENIITTFKRLRALCHVDQISL